jgi:hypothetical protein
MSLPRNYLIALVALISIRITNAAAQPTRYYLDSAAGDDRASGSSLQHPWRSLDAVNSRTFNAGDSIFIKAGTRYEGRLAPRASPDDRRDPGPPIIIDMYGSGPLPRIDAAGKYPEALLIRDTGPIEIRNLELTNLGASRQPGRTGIHVLATSAGVWRHIHFANLFVHDVNGDLRKSHEGCGIFFECRGDKSACFNDLAIERCHVAHADRNGICQRSIGGARSTHVVIRQNLLEDIGGDAIKIWGSNDALVECNVVRGGRTRCADAAAGIWPFDSDRTTIKYNEVTGMKGTIDGQAFDADYLCRGTLIQYNYSHDNEGGFLLACAPKGSYSQDTIVRYNISQNDGSPASRIIQLGGGTKHTLIYNNTIYIGPGRSAPLIACNDWNGAWASDTEFFNNIFYVDGQVTYNFGQSAGNTFDYNVFYGGHQSRPHDPHAFTTQPLLERPGSGAAGFGSLGGYRWKKASSAIPGTRIVGAPDYDFFGLAISKTAAPSIGASTR